VCQGCKEPAEIEGICVSRDVCKDVCILTTLANYPAAGRTHDGPHVLAILGTPEDKGVLEKIVSNIRTCIFF